MKKQLIEEILKFKLLSKYDTAITLEENKNYLSEQRGLGVLRDLETTRAMTSDLESLMRSGEYIKGGAFVTKDLKQLKTAEEVINALKKGLMSDTEAGRVYWNVFRKTDNPLLLKAISDEMVNSKSFIKNYGSLSKESFIARLKTKYKLSTEQAEALWRANSRRASNIGKEGEETLRGVEDATRGSERIGSQSQTVNININNAGEYERFAKDYYKTYGRDIDDIAKNNGHKNMEEWFRSDREGAMRKLYQEGSYGRKKGIFSRLWNTTKKTISLRGLWTLAKIAGGTWLIWWLFFKDKGYQVECEEGFKFVEGKGCVKKSGGGGEDDNDTNKTPTTDDEGNTYIECNTVYKIGCKTPKGNDDIAKAQDCLGLSPTGLFDKELENAIYNKINKRSFTKSDLPTICAKSYGGTIAEL